MADISNMGDVMDSRDVVERIEELEAERQALQDAFDEADEERAALSGSEDEEDSVKYAAADNRARDAQSDLDAWDQSEEGQELKALQAFREELEGYCGDKWEDGVTLIRDSYFVEYAQELAEDIGAIDHKASWPNTCIDWDKAARELQQDYTSGEFDGVTYWAR